MKLLLCADLHIKKKEELSLLQRILEAAKKEECKALLIGGDLFDSPFPEEEVARGALALLGAADLPILMVAGNHDPLDLTPCYRDLPQNVTLFGEAISAVSLGEGVVVYGLSDARGGKERCFSRPLAAEEGTMKIFLAHGQPDGSDEAYFPISTAALAESGFSLAVLGHVHKWEQKVVGGCRILLPGIPEGRGWDETGERFIWVAEVGAFGARLQPLKIAEKTYMEYEVDITDCNEEEALGRMEALEIAGDIEARLILVGAPLEGAEAAMRHYSAKYGRAVKDHTEASAASIELLMKQNTLQGAFTRRAMAEIEKASEEERPLLEEALRLGLAALKEGKR